MIDSVSPAAVLLGQRHLPDIVVSEDGDASPGNQWPNWSELSVVIIVLESQWVANYKHLELGRLGLYADLIRYSPVTSHSDYLRGPNKSGPRSGHCFSVPGNMKRFYAQRCLSKRERFSMDLWGEDRQQNTSSLHSITNGCRLNHLRTCIRAP